MSSQVSLNLILACERAYSVHGMGCVNTVKRFLSRVQRIAGRAKLGLGSQFQALAAGLQRFKRAQQCILADANLPSHFPVE